MRCLRLTVVATILVLVLSDLTYAQKRWAFQPQAANILGTGKARTPVTFTRVFTQGPGELAIARTQEHYVNLEPNWFKLAIGALLNPEFPIAYISITWADQVLRVTCFLDRAKSELIRGHFFVNMRATEGTIGGIPLGTLIGTAEGLAFFDAWVPVIKADVHWAPGIFPEVLPTNFNMSHQLVTDLWVTGGPGRVVALHTFTSVQPPDGSAPIDYTVQEGIPIQ